MMIQLTNERSEEFYINIDYILVIRDIVGKTLLSYTNGAQTELIYVLESPDEIMRRIHNEQRF